MKRIQAREEVCMACRLCEVNCLIEHSRSKDPIKAYKKETPRAMPRVRVDEKASVSFATLCRHCEQPVCVYSCITGAMRKDTDTGVVSVDQDKCVGCWTCVMVCPFGAVLPDTIRGKAVKCDLCVHRQTPACVENCPNQALTVVDEKVVVQTR
ncbi:MAG: 4Fe-4S dicluster domain-containing protein [Chloroflexota bacterium]